VSRNIRLKMNRSNYEPLGIYFDVQIVHFGVHLRMAYITMTLSKFKKTISLTRDAKPE